MLKFNKTGVPPTAEEISELEAKIGHKLPQQFTDFICNPESGVVYPNSYQIVPADNLAQTEGELRDFEPFKNFANGFHMISKEYTTPPLLPFAFTSCGDHICICIDEARGDYGAVYFLDHEFDASFSLIGSSFDEFAASLRPRDTSNIHEWDHIDADVALTDAARQIIEAQRNKKKLLP